MRTHGPGLGFMPRWIGLSLRVSRYHASVSRKDGMWQIEDAESLNGVVIKGQRVCQHVFNHDDRIHLSRRVILRSVKFP
jgi:pSer/pThr/pTyr-binding forkhead associated (FHA) protein